MQVVALPDPNDGSAAEADPEGYWAALMLQRVRNKASAEELDAWRLEQVGGASGFSLVEVEVR